MQEDVLALICHGAVGYQCPGQFQVPSSLTIGWYYDPIREDTVMCMSLNDIPTICQKAPPYLIGPGQMCPNLTLLRTDDINMNTGFYNCRTGQWIPVTRLGPSQVDPSEPDTIACLSDILNDVHTESGGHPFTILILACGMTAKYSLHPSRTTVFHPSTGQQQSLEVYTAGQEYRNQVISQGVANQQAQLMTNAYMKTMDPKMAGIRQQAFDAGQRVYQSRIQQGIPHEQAQAEATQVMMRLTNSLTKIGGRRRCSKHTRRKRGHKRTRKN